MTIEKLSNWLTALCTNIPVGDINILYNYLETFYENKWDVMPIGSYRESLIVYLPEVTITATSGLKYTTKDYYIALGNPVAGDNIYLIKMYYTYPEIKNKWLHPHVGNYGATHLNISSGICHGTNDILSIFSAPDGVGITMGNLMYLVEFLKYENTRGIYGGKGIRDLKYGNFTRSVSNNSLFKIQHLVKLINIGKLYDRVTAEDVDTEYLNSILNIYPSSMFVGNRLDRPLNSFTFRNNIVTLKYESDDGGLLLGVLGHINDNRMYYINQLNELYEKFKSFGKPRVSVQSVQSGEVYS